MIDDPTFPEVREELPLNEFLNYDAAESEKISFNECVHIIPDFHEQRIRIYRLVGNTREGNYDRIRHTIEGVTNWDITTFGDERLREVKSWCFQGGDGETILTLLAALKSERSPAEIKITYFQENNWPAIEDLPVDNETFKIGYETESGRSNEVMVHNCHSGHDVNYNANFK